MAALSLKEQIVQQLDTLSPQQQQLVLDYAIRLHSPLPPGIPGEALLARAREVNFDPQDIAEIMQAIEEECERIDWDGWQ